MVIVLLILAVVVIAAIAAGVQGGHQAGKEIDASNVVTTMLIGKALTDTTRRINNWDKQRAQREKEKWAWQEKVRRENSSFNEHFDDNF